MRAGAEGIRGAGRQARSRVQIDLGRRGGVHVAPVAPEKGRGIASLFLLYSMLGAISSQVLQGCADTKPIVSPEAEANYRIDTGFTDDLGTGPSMGHSIPIQAEVIRMPSCGDAGSKESRACTECRG